MPSQQLLTSLGETLGSGALVQELLATSGGSSDLGYIVVTDPAYGAIGDGVADDQSAVQAALTATPDGGLCYLPVGTYLVNGVVLTGTSKTFAGPGVLKRKAAATAQATLRLTSATRCLVDGITVDGSHELTVGATGTGVGIQLDATSEYNVLHNTFVKATKYVSSGGRGYYVIGDYNSLINPRAYDCDRTALTTNNNSTGTVIVNPIFVSQGLTNGATTGVRAIAIEGSARIYGGVIDQSAVDFDASVEGHNPFLCDPDGDIIEYCSLEGTTIISGGAGSGGNTLKFAKCLNIHLKDVRIVHAGTDYCSIRIAEDCEEVILEHVIADGQLFKENNQEAGHIPNRLFVDRCDFNGDATARESYAFEELNFKHIEIVRSTIHGDRGIQTTITDANLVRLLVDDVDWYGYSDGISPASNVFIFPSDAAYLRESRKYIVLNLRMHEEAAGLSYSGSNAARIELLQTRDRTGSNFYGTTAPASGSNTFAVGDFTWNTAPGATGLIGWLCTAAGTPGTWIAQYANDLLSSNVTEVANGTTVETDLMTYSLPDTDALSNAVMGANGEGLDIECGFSFAANGNTKTVKFYLGASEIYTSGAAAHNGGAMTLRVRIMRDGSAAAQKCHVTAVVTGTGTPFVDKVQYTATTVNLATAATVLKATGQSGTASTDVVQEWMTVRHLRVAG